MKRDEQKEKLTYGARQMLHDPGLILREARVISNRLGTICGMEPTKEGVRNYVAVAATAAHACVLDLKEGMVAAKTDENSFDSALPMLDEMAEILDTIAPESVRQENEVWADVLISEISEAMRKDSEGHATLQVNRTCLLLGTVPGLLHVQDMKGW